MNADVGRGKSSGRESSAVVEAQLVRSVQRLVDAVQRVGDGHLEHRVQVVADDPLRKLVTAFNVMAERLQAASVAKADEANRRNARVRKKDAGLAKDTQELERSNVELEQFAYAASHDLQEPLRMVSSYADLLSREYKGKLSEEADTYLDYMKEGAQRMKRLIGDLLELSRVDTHGDKFTSLSSQAALEEAIENLRTAMDESGATVTFDALPEIWGDESQLVRLFQNLLSNALKFRRSEPPKVRVSAVKSGGNWKFSVKDNGIGIDAKYFDRIFIVFKHLHTRQEYEGSGMGLTTAKRIVHRHGGEIWVDSQPNKGSTFFFTLPAEPVPQGGEG